MSVEADILEMPGDLQEAVVLGDLPSRALRHTLQRNNMERSMCERQTRHLDSQRRTIKCQLDREEKELRHQLQRLHEEKKVFTRLDSLQDELILQSMSQLDNPTSSAESITLGTDQEPEVAVINPYPVAIRRHLSAVYNNPSDEHGNTGDSPPRSDHGRRRVSVEFEDLQLQTSTGKIFPPLFQHPRRPLAFGLAESISMVTLTNSGNASPHEQEQPGVLWVGAPEAIQSVRRPRKTISQQRLDSLLAKSATYREIAGSKGSLGDEGGQVQGRGSQGRGFSRSQSLKERRQTRLHSATPSGGGISSGCKRTGSWKEGRAGRSTHHLTAQSVDSVKEAFLVLDIRGGGGGGQRADRLSPCTPRHHFRHRGNPAKSHPLIRHPSITSLRDYVATPETKSCVWGTVTVPIEPPHGISCSDVSKSSAASTHVQSGLLQRRRRCLKQQEPSCSFPPITPVDGASSSSGKPGSSPLPSPSREPVTSRSLSPQPSVSHEVSFKRKT